MNFLLYCSSYKQKSTLKFRLFGEDTNFFLRDKQYHSLQQSDRMRRFVLYELIYVVYIGCLSEYV